MKITLMKIIGLCLFASFVCIGCLPATKAESQSFKVQSKYVPPVQKSIAQLQNEQFEVEREACRQRILYNVNEGSRLTEEWKRLADRLYRVGPFERRDISKNMRTIEFKIYELNQQINQDAEVIRHNMTAVERK